MMDHEVDYDMDITACQYVKFVKSPSFFSSFVGEYGYLFLLDDMIYFFGRGDNGAWLTATGIALASDVMKIYSGRVIPTSSIKNLYKIVKNEASNDGFNIGSRYSFLINAITAIAGKPGRSKDNYIMIITANGVKYHFEVGSKENYLGWKSLL